jgi:ribonuclease J
LLCQQRISICVQALACTDSACKSESLRVYSEIMNKERKWEKEAVQPLYSDQYVTHTSIRENPDSFILCFSFFDMKHLLDVKPDGGTYIYSACEAFSEEMKIDFVRLWHWLERFNIDPVGFSVEKKDNGKYKPCFDKQFLPLVTLLARTSLGPLIRSIQILLCQYILRPGIGSPGTSRMWLW